MRQKKIWIPLIVLIGITGGFIFYQHHTAPLEPIKVYPTDIDTGDKPKTSQAPPASTTPVEPASHGHYHEDGTFHAEPHAPPIIAADKTPDTQLSRAQMGVPDPKRDDSARFREWKQKNDALAERRRKHMENSKDLSQQTTQQLVNFLMLTPIENRRKALEAMKQQLRAAGASETTVSQRESDFKAMGFDLVTEVPADAAVRIQEVRKAMHDNSPKLKENLKVSEQLMREQTELFKIAEDF